MTKCKNCKCETTNKKFCSQKCYLEYRRTHFKKKRSKLEKYVSRQLHKDFPNIIIQECNREVLENLELDLYFPELKLAIEINGKMHYQFIKYFHKTYKRFHEQLKRDKFKKQKCQELGINLVIIPNFKAFTNKLGKEIYNYVREIVLSHINKDYRQLTYNEIVELITMEDE